MRKMLGYPDWHGLNNPNWRGGLSKDHQHRYLLEKIHHPERIKARQAVMQAKRRNLLQPQACQRCGSTKNLLAHHEDYNKPLSVIWLCNGCHQQLHNGYWNLKELPTTA